MSFACLAALYRERRRIGLVTLLAFVAGVLFFLPSGLYVGPVHISLVTGAVYAAVVGIAAILICIFLPRMRFMIEAVAISRLAIAVSVALVPNIGPALHGSPLFMAFIVVLGGVLVSRLIHGPIDRGPKQRFAVGPRTYRAVAANGTRWQRGFVAWVEGSVPRPVTA